MRRVREILRYRFEQGLGHKSIAIRVGAAPSTVRETLRRAAIAELSWPLGDDVSDAVLEGALHKAAGTKTGHRRSPEPDWALVHRELKRKHMTLQIPWDEYISRHPDGYRCSRYCDLYCGWAMKLPVTMRQDHAAGDKLFVDYAGDTVKRVLRRVGVTRRQLFDELDRPALRPLPVERYVFAEWRIRRAGLDYHVEIERHYYSVPYRFAREQVEARITANTIEIFHKGERIAAHRRSSGNGKHTTIPDHMPSAHRRFADWTIERIQREASAMGPNVALLCERILADRPHPEQGFRACLGIIRLNKSFGRDRVNGACGRALEIGARTYGSVRSILDNHLDRTTAPNGSASHEPIHHANIRGPRYYH
ncbi:Mu transposase domain-containing protein [Sinorhizobium meliloti]|uniref:Mu transposase domain-containing protein n=1 Tax=Rhizobium meliloti TaxID=382 RepID=UPI000B4A2649|nr:IS21 family transposase [Sinorhizobium meliloti]ASQ06001.1 IS21 family transposase [Sinorhizobium meliloti]MQV33043.1 IS21 family transposase [Sinorhizobium meliloti]RVE85689.1 IS21 family transposase [Sinorhizobium meliloti]RVG49062.1 IS21 family transposase [Sinorhizobium meliloti]RVM03692.1 IS21 family transposase [Sinorhizobium meliloti]